MRRARWTGAVALLAGAGLAASAASADPSYQVVYDAKLVPATRSFEVALRVKQPGDELRSLAFRADPERHAEWRGDGSVEAREGSVVWEVPRGGGTLRYVFRIDQLRGERAYDARAASEWAIFRGGDLVPPAAARTRKGATSRARLVLRLPEGWSAATRFSKSDAGGYRVESEGRGFDRPTGWMLVARRLGVVRESVAGVRVAVAGPAGQDLRRLDILALLRWTLPELRKVVPGAMPERLLLVGAGDPMWRGGLSGPGSAFIHADRPLLTPDGTSPLLHEVLHTALPRGSAASEDWLVEGLAEFYAIRLLERSKTFSKARAEKTLKGLAEEGRGVRSVRVARSTGAVTARAVTLLAELDRKISSASGGVRSLDDAVRRMAEQRQPLALASLRAAAEAAAGTALAGFFEREIFAAAAP